MTLMHETQPPRVSVAIPLYEEEEGLPELLRRLSAVVDGLPGEGHEMVFVDDGSGDRTPELLRSAAVADPRITVVSLSRNFGHQAALSAALEFVEGDVVVLMDGDLQDAPEAIPAMLERVRDGYDVVYAKRDRRKEPWWLRLSYFTYYRLLSTVSNVDLPVDAGDFAAFTRPVLNAILSAPERHRYLRGLRAWAGFRQTGIPVERDARHHGRSKYGLRKLLRLASDGIFSFSIVPIRVAAALGGLSILATSLFALYALWAKIFLDRSPQGFTAQILVITFVSGVNLLFLGIIGEYVGRVYEETKARPLYVVRRVQRGGDEAAQAPKSTGIESVVRSSTNG
ncbi:MAG: glycosyltransferase family 2 protein [Gemmatimonadota bacterium]|nr:glycosyltransferase family 2 protein [Gemmatimonadota bacterium]